MLVPTLSQGKTAILWFQQQNYFIGIQIDFFFLLKSPKIVHLRLALEILYLQTFNIITADEVSGCSLSLAAFM